MRTSELSGLQEAQEEAMMDTCIIQVFSSVADDLGEPIASYTDGDAISCGLNNRGGRELQDANMTLLITDATVRLPIDTAVVMQDRVQVTHRFGVAAVSTYEVVGPVRRGPSGLQVDVKAVTI